MKTPDPEITGARSRLGVAARRGTPETKAVRLEPRTYNEARAIGEAFRSGKAVLLSLEELGDDDAERLVDFAAGLVFSAPGSIDRVTSKVFLLVPPQA